VASKFHPFQPVGLHVPDNLPWQDWIVTDMLNSDGTPAIFNCDSDPSAARGTNTTPRPFQPQTVGVGGRSLPPLDGEHIAKILEVMYTLPTWKACIMEGMNWAGTAEENIQKYNGVIGIMNG